MLQFFWENICQLNIWVGIEYILPTLGGWMWVGEFLCALRAQGWLIYIFWNIQWYESIAYMLPTIWGIYVSWIYSLVLDISCQHLGDKCKLVVKSHQNDENPRKTKKNQEEWQKNNEKPGKTMKSREKQWNTMKNSEKREYINSNCQSRSLDEPSL